MTSKHKARGRVKKGRAHTLMTSGDCSGVIVRRPDGTLTIRTFTPREAYRLQGFPDWSYDRVRASGQTDSDLYFESGNSLGVPIIREIFHVIDEYSMRNGYVRVPVKGAD
ncbi:MAG: DNA methyltransferase [Thermoplasmata archaeon]|nr:DNA methyltransferase [Thermoplasmata archaeon]